MAHHHDAVAQRHGFRLIVGDVDCGNAEFAQQGVDIHPQAFAQQRVQRRERLVEKKHARLHRDRSRQRHPLTLTAGELIDLPVLRRMEA